MRQQQSSVTGIAFLAISLLLAAPARAESIQNSWSEVSNPTGNWSLREGTNVLPHVAIWTTFDGVDQPAWAETSVPNAGHIPVFFQAVVTPADVNFDFQLGDIIIHSTDGVSGGGNGLANLVWTSPATAEYDISGATWLARNIGRAVDWQILLNDTLLTSGSLFDGDAYSRAAPFDLTTGSGGAAALQNVAVIAGDRIRFQLVTSSNAGELVGLQFSVTAVPEPGSIVLTCVSGLASMAFWWRRRRAQ